MLLSKSTFTIIPSCVSTFSTLIFSYTFLSILNVHLTSLCLPPSLVVPFGTSIHVLLCYAFPCSGCTTILQFYHGCFLLVLYSGHQIFLLSSSDIFPPTIVSFFPYFVHLTLLPVLLFFYFYASRQFLYYTFLSFSSETKSCSWFSSVLVSLQSYSLHSTNVTTFYLVFQPLLSSAVLLGGIPCTPLYSCAFFHKECTGFSPCCVFCGLTIHATFLLLLFAFSTFIFGYSHFLIPKALYSFFFCLLSPYTHSFSYSILYYSTCYYLKFVLGSWFPLHLFLFISAVMGQIPEPFILLTYSFFSFLYFYSQFGEGMLLVEHSTHERVILLQKHNATSLEKSNKK